MPGLGSPTLRGRSFDLTTTDTAAQRPDAAREGLLARHPLISFFGMAFAFSWIAWSPWVLSEEGVGLLPYPVSSLPWLPLGIFLGPTLSGFIMTGITEGRAGVRRLLHRIVLWRGGVGGGLFSPLRIPVGFNPLTVIFSGGA